MINKETVEIVKYEIQERIPMILISLGVLLFNIPAGLIVLGILLQFEKFEFNRLTVHDIISIIDARLIAFHTELAEQFEESYPDEYNPDTFPPFRDGEPPNFSDN